MSKAKVWESKAVCSDGAAQVDLRIPEMLHDGRMAGLGSRDGAPGGPMKVGNGSNPDH